MVSRANPSVSASLDSLISQLMPRLAGVSLATAAHNPVSAMASPLDALTTTPLPLNTLGAKLSAAVKTGVVEAVVLSSTPLPTTDQSSTAKHHLTLSDGKQQFELTTKTALPSGTQLQIKLAEATAAAVLLKVINQPETAVAKPTVGTQASPTTHRQAVLTNTPNTLTNRSPADPNSLISHNPSANTQTGAVIRQGLREALPQQQPIRQLTIFLLQALQQQVVHKSPQVTQRITHLLAQFPTAEQMQQARPARVAIENSGVFLESKLAKLAMTKSSAPITEVARLLAQHGVGSDLKAQIQNLAQWIQKTTQAELSATQPSTSKQSTANLSAGSLSTATLATPSTLRSDADAQDLLVYTAKPEITTTTHIENTTKPEQHLDILLRQLGRQLLASIARTQINQLESLGTRQSNNADNQAPVNSWVTEIPILNGKDVDNLTLRIDQDYIEQKNDNTEQAQKLWTVMLAFDLHTLGKMNVQLKIIDRTVSATVWSSQQDTHARVKKHIAELTGNLKKIGVSVQKVQCRLGQPPEQKSPLLKQLVDVRT